MDDVIFAGSGNRPARNNAEVTLTHRQYRPHGAGRVQRKRDARGLAAHRARAGSTYRINGREVRARDVQILFADASTGSQSPALVRQGQIGEIIQAKPEQRRRVLEEAAGISGLHARRHEAELRLKAAEQNLAAARRRDQPAQGSDRRAEAAGAAGGALPHVSAEIRKLEATLLHLRWHTPRRSGPRPSGRDRACAGRRPHRGAGRPRSAAARRPAALPPLREAEARPARACSGWCWRATRSTREEARAKERIAELDRSRSPQLADDIDRERRSPPMPRRAGAADRRGCGLAARAEASESAPRRAGQRVAKPKPRSPRPRRLSAN